MTQDAGRVRQEAWGHPGPASLVTLHAGEPELGALLARLEALAQVPTFAAQRQIALTRALRPYLEYGDAAPLEPTPEEIGLALLYLYADFFPEDGQLSLIEQLRDLVEVHVSSKERAWLDPLRHSYMDLLEVVEASREDGAGTLTLRSLGDGRTAGAAAGALIHPVRPGQVLLTRLLRKSQRVVLPGPAVVLASGRARAIKEGADEWRRALETETGAFALGEWREFAKRFGYVLLWQVAQVRLKLLAEASARIRYRTGAGEPVLYAMALYEHADPEGVTRELSAQAGWTTGPEGSWVLPSRQTGTAAPEPVGRLTVTPTQLWVEADGPERLDALKHALAATFGYRLRFRGEAAAPPAHPLPEVDLATDEGPALAVTVPAEEARRLIAAFLETCYLQWADQPSLALDGLTPRHAAADECLRPRVAALIDRMERDDLGRRRTGQPGYDYGRLRAHVGL